MPFHPDVWPCGCSRVLLRVRPGGGRARSLGTRRPGGAGKPDKGGTVSDDASRAAIRAAGTDEDARWRVMPAFGPWLWGFFALIQVCMAVLYLGVAPSAAAFQLVLYPLLAGLGAFMCVWSMSWTAARADGLRLRNGWQTHEISWDHVASIESTRMWGFRLTTRSGQRRIMQGVTQSRIGLLLYLWEHYRGPAEPQRALGDRGRQGWWPAEPQRYMGARIGVVLLVVIVTMVATGVVLLSGLSFWVTVPIGALAFGLTIVATVRVMFAGTVLGPEGVKVRTPVTIRRVPWASVQHVVVSGQEVALVTGEGPVTLVGVPAGEAATIERFRAQGAAA